MPLREFRCSEGHVTEKFLQGEADVNTRLISCEHTGEGLAGGSQCLLPADRMDISAPYVFSDDFRGADRWSQKRQKEYPIRHERQYFT